MTDADALNKCKYIVLVSYEEAPDTMDLRLVVDEARAEEVPSQINTGNAKIDAALGDARAILSKPEYRTYEIIFENYIAFSIRNESFAEPEDTEDYSKRLRTYKKSNFLKFVKTSTIADQFLSEPILHFCVVCSDHVIDVACASTPEIRLQ